MNRANVPPVPAKEAPTMVFHSDRPMTLSIEEAAEELGVGRNMMYELVHREDFPAMKIGKSWRVSTRCLEEWVATKATKREEI